MMARIRSIHPGLWTDEAFMSLSAHARLLLIGIWTEAFDDGVFDWKPLTLKARIFPVDSVDVSVLLDELRTAGIIDRDDDHERRPGLIRNFQKFQRPKKPNSSGWLRDEWRTFVGCGEASSEPVEHRYGTSTEKSPQMEDGGDKGKEASASKRAMRLPEDWTIPEDWLQEAISAGLSRDRALSEAERMKNWSRSSPKGVKIDWHAAWRNWFKDKIDAPSQRANAPPRKRNYVDAAMDRMRQANGSESVFGNHGNVERLPARSEQSGPDASDVRGGIAGRYASGGG